MILFLVVFDFSSWVSKAKKKHTRERGNLLLLEKKALVIKKGKTNFNKKQHNETRELFYKHITNQKQKRRNKKKENERRGSGNVWRGFRRRFRRERYGREIRTV